MVYARFLWRLGLYSLMMSGSSLIHRMIVAAETPIFAPSALGV